MSDEQPGLSELDAYDFELPPERIAQHALSDRTAARLMHLDRKSGQIGTPGADTRVRDLPQLLRPGDLLVVNATKVLPARLRGTRVDLDRSSGGAVEALLLGPVGSPTEHRYRALVKIGSRLRAGLRFEFAGAGHVLEAELAELGSGGEVVLAFGPGPSPYALGEAPLPPYIRRRSPSGRGDAAATQEEPGLRDLDLERYQTFYAREPGAVAAPTAGLHLTRELRAALESAGIEWAEIVLHVGPGTFRPVRAENLSSGRLHSEAYELPEATAEAVARARSLGGRVVAVGTTSTRVLEACGHPNGTVEPARGETDIFLRPGSRFDVVDGLLTNFHLPRSSLLMLVAAFAGREPVLAAYRRAVEGGYRFYSYGDAMLII
jgi:S-adenosylmethionine:tRNA ribosyltransferase-isomerase